jgi:SAM-dependent methyltransferase
MLGYRQRILEVCATILSNRVSPTRALDFGSGDGWFAASFLQRGLVSEVIPVDILRRQSTIVEPILYSGDGLPFEDRSFEFAYCIDTLHHCTNPIRSLKELMRCARRYILIKDHTYSTFAEKLTLCLLDEIGNRRHGVKSPYHYQKSWEWDAIIEDEGFERECMVYPAHCHPRVLQPVLSRMQYVALWRRFKD